MLADEMGIVMGTSHHEPMMRSHREYLKRKNEVGPWNYATNPERIEKFFLDGMKRNCKYDNLVTIGMRGDGDTAMGMETMLRTSKPWGRWLLPSYESLSKHTVVLPILCLSFGLSLLRCSAIMMLVSRCLTM